MIRILFFAILAALAAASPARAQDRLTVLLEWFVNPDHAPLVVARELGLFEKAGLAVELVPPADPSIVPRAVASGQAEIGIHYQPNLYLDHAAGVPLVRFGTLVETPLNTLTVLADGPVRAIADRVALLDRGRVRWQGGVAEMDAAEDDYLRDFVAGRARPMARGPQA